MLPSNKEIDCSTGRMIISKSLSIHSISWHLSLNVPLLYIYLRAASYLAIF